MTAATYFSTQMAQLTGNAGGGIQSLPAVTVAGGRERVFIANVAFASQPAGSVIAVARLPLGAIITGLAVIVDTSTGAATLAFGDTNTPALYAAAATYTTTQTPAKVGLTTSHGVPITTGYDALSGNAVTYQKPSEGGALYEDVTITVGAAALPASGNLLAIFEYAID